MNFAVPIGIENLQNVFQFPAVKPQTVMFSATIDSNILFAADSYRIHFFKAYRAFSFAGRFFPPGLESSEHRGCFLRVAQENFHLTRIKPNSSAAETMVDFDLIDF